MLKMKNKITNSAALGGFRPAGINGEMWNSVAQKLYDDMPAEMPPEERKRLLRIMRARFDRAQLPDVAKLADKFYDELTAEGFTPGAILIIIIQAEKLANKEKNKLKQLLTNTSK